MRHLFLSLIIVFTSSMAMAAEKIVLSEGAEGEVIPSFEAADQNGQPQSFETLKGEKGAVLVFFRSVDWCPFCQRQLKALSGYAEQYKSLGYNLVGVSYDNVDSLMKFSDKNELGFTLLSDVGSKIIKSFGILNTDIGEGSKAYGTPNPTIYVVDDKGVIQAILAEEGYKDRPNPADILGYLR